MSEYDLTIIDGHNNQIVKVERNVCIPDRMRIRRQYQGLEHDGRYTIIETKRAFDSLGYPQGTSSR